jgi:dUTP pyrophosphatase
MEPYFKILKLYEDVKVPTKRIEDAGYDIYASPIYMIENDREPIYLHPGELVFISTGFKMAIPPGYVFMLKERGSTGSKGLAVRCGIIDSGFRDEVKVILNNTSTKDIAIIPHEEFEYYDSTYVTLYDITKAICQGLLIKEEHFNVEVVSELPESIRGKGMLGSTGK